MVKFCLLTLRSGSLALSGLRAVCSTGCAPECYKKMRKVFIDCLFVFLLSPERERETEGEGKGGERERGGQDHNCIMFCLFLNMFLLLLLL